MKRYFISIIIAVFFLNSAGVGLAENTDELIAVGDGFEIRQSDVGKFQAFIEKGNQGTTQEEYQKGTLQIKLFTLEAKRLGLEKNNKAIDQEEDIFQKELLLNALYAKYLMDEYTLDDIVIESYYHAHPEMFRPNEESELEPLDDFWKVEIRQKIVEIQMMKIKILQQEQDRLMKKYNARFCDQISGGCK